MSRIKKPWPYFLTESDSQGVKEITPTLTSFNAFKGPDKVAFFKGLKWCKNLSDPLQRTYVTLFSEYVISRQAFPGFRQFPDMRRLRHTTYYT